MDVHMRNKVTGEIRDVELDSDEFRGLRAEVTSKGLPMWEQTNFPAAEAIRGRAEYGELLEEDLGHEHQDELLPAALALDAEGVGPEQNPHLALTPGEIEAGLTPQQKLEDLKSQFDQDRVSRRGEVFDNAAERIAGDRERKSRQAAQPAKGQLARAGGSDEREGVPRPQARDEEDSGSGAATDDGGTIPEGGDTAAHDDALATGVGSGTEGEEL